MLDARSQTAGDQHPAVQWDETAESSPAGRRRLPWLVALALLIALAAGIAVPPPWETGGASSDEPVAGDDPTSSADDEAQDADGDLGGDQDPGSGQEDPGGDQREGFDEGQGADLDELPDGEHFGFVTAFTVDAVTFEPAEFLTGDDALEAAREDGAVGPGEDLANDFYIRYPDTGTLTLPVAADFEASLLDNVDLSQSRTLDAESVAALYAGDLDAPWMYGPLEMLPVVLRVQGGEVTRADGQYVP